MRSLKLIPTICAILLACSIHAEEESAASVVTPINEITCETLDFDLLPKESIIGSLSEYVAGSETLLDLLTESVKRKKQKALLYPFAEGLVYLNGVLCHVGNYSQSIIYTVLEGPQYGLQTVTTYDGFVLYVNYEYVLEYTPAGVILHHDYADSETITGSTQVISFHRHR